MPPKRWGTAAIVAMLLAGAAAWAQGPTQPSAAQGAGQAESNLGPLPGAPGGGVGSGGDLSGGLLIGGHGRRVPSSIARPGGLVRLPVPKIETLPAPRRRQPTRPRLGTLAIPLEAEDEGPPDGLSLEEAIERLRRENLGLRAKHLEIPQAQADILSAGLRANPFVYGDGQLLPYGRYNSVTNPGGPAQYDVNVTLPVDWNLKRRTRTAVAQRAKNVVEALYQNAVRTELGNLYNAYVDVLAARETARLARAAMEGIDQILAAEKARRKATPETQLEFDQINLQRDGAELVLLEAEAALRTSKRRLGALLNLPREEADRLELRGTMHDRLPSPPPVDELVRLALAARPDMAAFRLGVERAQADVELARANRFSDAYLLYQPFTYQNNQPFGTPSSRSWALGATVAVPLWDRNQGVIRRARTNVEQTRIETRALERIVITEVEDAYEEYVLTRAAVARLQTHLLPDARRVLDDNLRLYREGQAPLLAYLNAQRDYGDLVRQYRDALVRHRRSMLDLNTAVGQRVLP